MGDTNTTAEAARKRKLRKRRQLRKNLRRQMNWRGRPVPPLGWYVAVLAVACGIAYGVLHDRGDADPSGIGVVVAGVAAGVLWGAVVMAVAPPIIAVPVIVAGIFVFGPLFGPAYPSALSAWITSTVAGWFVGIAIRYRTVGRRRPPPAQPLVDRTRPRRKAPIGKSERSSLVSSAIAGVGLLALPVLLFVVPTPRLLTGWLLLAGLALAWAIPTGWWSARAQSHHAVGGAPLQAATWGVMFNAWGAAGVHGMPFALTAGMGGVAIGFVLRRLWEARVGRYPWQRPAPATGSVTSRNGNLSPAPTSTPSRRR
jgi:hypothetical protein